MQIVSYNWSYVDGTYIKFCIPTSLDTALPEPKGYIATSSINDYENSCIHVAYDNCSYDADGEPVTFFYTNTFNEHNYVDSCWRYNCTCLATWKNSKHKIVNNGVDVFYGTHRVCYRKSSPGSTIQEIPNFPTQDELVTWLLNNGYSKIGSGGTGYVAKTVSKLLCVESDISPVTAKWVYDRFLKENPIEPSASTAFFSTVSELKFNSNSIANAMEVADLCKSLLSVNQTVKKARTAVQTAADAWLQYRYCYNTTKSDVEELRRFSREVSDEGTLRAAFVAGSASGHMKIRYAPTANTMLRRLLSGMSGLQRLGLDPSLYNLWDIVPFSFIADWFVPIGDNLERIANMKWAATMPYDVECIASLKGTVTYNSTSYRVYTRFKYSPSYELTWLSKGDTQMSTWGKRGLDVIALTR